MKVQLDQATRKTSPIVRGEWEHQIQQASGRDCYALTSGLLAATNWHSPLFRPTEDEVWLSEGGAKPEWPGGASFAVCLTHDVDHVARLNPRIHARRLGNQMRCFANSGDRRAWRGLQGTTRHLIHSVCSWRRRDPLYCYERWLELESQVGARSTFLFLPDHYAQKHDTDGGYRYHDRVVFDRRRCTVAQMMKEIHCRGWEVGLHASWMSATDAKQLREQKDQVEEAIAAEVRSVRHHHLHYHPSLTPRAHHEAGLKIDSSLGLNDMIGFRRGTAYPWRLQDAVTEETLQVWEIPLAIQDRVLMENHGCGDPELALRWAVRMAQSVQQVGGCLTLLWHPESIERASWMTVYTLLLEQLSQMGAWFGTMGQICDWWQQSVVNLPATTAQTPAA